ncbi:MAG: hypothetical protein M3O25_08080 [Actinomycetota bacterium]|nr:hypothetical protein [Actinomycetota bacterium]
MRVAVLVGALAIVAISMLAIVGVDLGGDEAEPAAPRETADPVPQLPPGWSVATNEEIGVAVGVPPGWSNKVSPKQTTLRAPGSTVVVSVIADRSEDAIGADLSDYCQQIAEDLQEDEAAIKLDPGGTEEPKVGAGYEVASVKASLAPTPSGAGGQLQVFVVRRPELAAYPILLASGAGVRPAEVEPIVSEIVASLRGRPATAG